MEVSRREDWREYRDGTGKTYYHNVATKETTWAPGQAHSTTATGVLLPSSLLASLSVWPFFFVGLLYCIPIFSGSSSPLLFFLTLRQSFIYRISLVINCFIDIPQIGGQQLEGSHLC